jgi:predicted methyltransferase
MTARKRRRLAAAGRSGRFAVLLVLAGIGAFLVGTRFVAPPRSPAHPLTGRIIPGIATDAAWMERAGRAQEEDPDRALALIGVNTGMTVADIGAGTGYMTTRLAALVGPAGTVYANEIQPELLRRLETAVRGRGLQNVQVVPGAEDDARLPERALDIALLVDVYHELHAPQSMLRSIGRSLKADGRLVLVEYRQEDPTLPIAAAHRTSIAGLRAEIEPEGFLFERTSEELPRQHIIVFRKRPAQ